MLVKTSELGGEALNFAVVVAEGHNPTSVFGHTCYVKHGSRVYPNYLYWEEAGPIIEREHIEIRPTITQGGYRTSDSPDAVEARILLPDGATIFNPLHVISEYGPSPLIAAMRCFVASKLGDEVEIPDRSVEGKGWTIS